MYRSLNGKKFSKQFSTIGMFSFQLANRIDSKLTQKYIIFIFYKKMFPYSNYSDQLTPFQPSPQHMYQNIDFSTSLNPFGTIYYFTHPSYYQPNVNFMPFLQTTLPNEESSGNLRLYQGQESGKIDKNQTIKNYSSSTTEEKMSYENHSTSKTRPIQRKGRELLMLANSGLSKSKKVKNFSKYNQSEYSAEEETKKKTDEHIHLYLKYRRKNTESNIVNRIYSFLTSEFKNKHELNKLKLTDVQKQTYLKYLLTVVDAWKGPVKRQLLFGLMNVTESLPAFKVLQKMYETDKILSLKEFGYLNRALIRTYLSKIAAVSIITSKKMKKSVWKQHLQKIRELNQYFFEFQNYGS